MTWIKTPKLISNVFYRLKWDFETGEKVIYLTFDDGPTTDVTDFVLTQLKFFNAKATFFCLGRNVEKYPEIYKKIIELGHKTGNHSYSHLNGWKTNFRTYISDIELAKTYINSRLFRPPYGKMKQTQKFSLLKRYKIIMWDILSHDYDKKTTPEKCVSNVLTHVKNGSIIVFHDSLKASKNLYYTLPVILNNLSEQGYEFRSIH
ncbi:MAG: polysaccharide deacetylase family protein [Chlorobi bacterium]|nr:polysaccharide deacetylase family protein [Chlorobiota bacterium]